MVGCTTAEEYAEWRAKVWQLQLSVFATKVHTVMDEVPEDLDLGPESAAAVAYVEDTSR